MADPAPTKPNPVRAHAKNVRSVAKMSRAMDPVLSIVESNQNDDDEEEEAPRFCRCCWGSNLPVAERRR